MTDTRTEYGTAIYKNAQNKTQRFCLYGAQII